MAANFFLSFVGGWGILRETMADLVNKKQERKKDFNPWLVYIFCFSVSLVFMFFYGLNSPIHTFNSHCDYNWFLTVGRGIVAGKIPYRDLFEHKGPITYFVYGFAALFPNPQVIIWFIEVVCISLFLFFAYRIARKFISRWMSMAVVPVVMMMLSANFVRGVEGSTVEEFCLPIFAYGLLCFLDFLMDQRAMTWQRSLAIGICLGILFWVKFLMWEFFFVPMLIWLVINLVRRNLIGLLRSGLIMVGGILIVTLPILIYFAVVGALDSLWEVYFLSNILSYTGHDSTNLWELALSAQPWINCSQALLAGFYFVVLFFVGIFAFARQYRRQKGWLLPLAAIVSWLLVGFFCGYVYYFLPLFTYGILGAVYLVKGVCFVFKSIEIEFKRQWANALMIALVFVISVLLALPGVTNVVEINRPREEYVPLVVADILAEYNETAEKSATLFCYRMSDQGFYNAAGLIPNVRYFAQNSFSEESLPEMYQAFDETIRNQVCDFVVVLDSELEEHQDFLLSYYDYYYGTLEKSTFTYSYFEPDEYLEEKIILLFRR